MSKDEELTPMESHMNSMQRMRTTDSVIVPRDVFEKLYLNPQSPGSHPLRKTFGNPTPIALIGFLLSSTPNACTLMGWRGAGGDAGALLPVFIFFGGVVQIIAAVGEWILGNTFSCAIFSTYGAFWLVQGATLQPFYAVGAHYSPTGNSLEGQTTPAYFATTGYYYLFLAVVSFVFVICAFRANICLVGALTLLVVAFGLLAGADFQMALGEEESAARLKVVAGAFVFALCIIIWYLFIVQLLESVDFPVTLPVGDLTNVIPGKSERRRRKKELSNHSE